VQMFVGNITFVTVIGLLIWGINLWIWSDTMPDTYFWVFFFNLHSYCSSWYYQSFIYSPTDAL